MSNEEKIFEGSGQSSRTMVKEPSLRKPETVPSASSAMDDEFVKVSMKEKLSYCFGDPALTVVYTLTASLLVYFYTNVIGMDAGVIGIILLVSRIFDAFSDVIMGIIIDRTESKHGKARVWLLRMLIPYAIAPTLLMSVPPSFSDAGKAVFVFITYNFMNTIVYTGISQPFHALGSRITRDQHERDTISNIRMALSITASMIITAFMLPFVNWVAARMRNEQLAWIVVTAGVSVVSIAILLNTFFGTKERVRAAERTQEKVPAMRAVKIMITNKYFLISLGLTLFYTVYQILSSTNLTYYCQYILGDINLVMPLSVAEKLPMIFVILMLPKLIPNFGKRKLIMYGCVLGIVGQLVFMMNPTNVMLATVTSVMRGVGMAPFYGLSFSLPNDAIEYGHWKTGTRVEAMMFSSMQFGQKFGAGMTSALFGIALAKAGFDGLLPTQTAAATGVIYSSFIYLPIAIFIVMIVIAAFYKLDDKYSEIMSDLAARESK